MAPEITVRDKEVCIEREVEGYKIRACGTNPEEVAKMVDATVKALKKLAEGSGSAGGFLQKLLS